MQFLTCIFFYYTERIVQTITFFFFGHVACEVFVPRPAPPALEARSLNHWTTKEVPQTINFFFFYIFIGA